MKRKLIALCLLATISLVHAQKKGKSNESMDKLWGETGVSSDALKSGKAKLFDESNFGMFIHWGLYSHLGGVWNGKTYYGIGEWIKSKNVASIPDDEYMAVAKEFNPTKFDPKAIAKLAKDAGMKYIVITSKHHEGFAMFDSKVNDFNIVKASPYGRDPMKELSAACREIGLGFGFYYSHNQDWTAPGGHKGPKVDENGKPATFKDYFYNKCKPQVKEICTNYGEIDFVWFDTPGKMPKEYVLELEKMVRKLQPNAMLGSRIGYGLGDYASEGDMEVPNRNIEGLWETCDTNNDSWSYAWYDNNFKSPKLILERLIATIGRGGTYLFNVGPDGTGTIPEIGQKFLREAGKWIKKHPQVVYGAGSSPWKHALAWGDVTTKGNSLFLSVYDWPQDKKLYLPGLKTKILSVNAVGGTAAEKITFDQQKDWTVLNVPYQPINDLISVIELKLDTKVEEVSVDSNYGVYPNIENHLLAEFAEVTNAEKKEIKWMEKFGEWIHVKQISKWKKDSKAEWTVNVLKPGYYYLDLKYKGSGRLVWKTITDEGVLVQNQQAATEKFVYYNMGILEFKTAGMHKISVSLVEGDPETSSLEAAKITPIK
ncbi:alpha-L-fucosidase [Tamlana agarivorans]|uniref:Alpha-L-fucosidase n=1 Tax=Pseudotamlana agarivorans TaxID=481183 RepID=A0ACC5U9M0_9FLAO|nr:alpha-L-fucosidase [Tamlana agarivorans]MBU2950944.1 alpha-L-fucosidase [Tamlana agarivorans]